MPTTMPTMEPICAALVFFFGSGLLGSGPGSERLMGSLLPPSAVGRARSAVPHPRDQNADPEAEEGTDRPDAAGDEHLGKIESVAGPTWKQQGTQHLVTDNADHQANNGADPSAAKLLRRGRIVRI